MVADGEVRSHDSIVPRWAVLCHPLYGSNPASSKDSVQNADSSPQPVDNSVDNLCESAPKLFTDSWITVEIEDTVETTRV